MPKTNKRRVLKREMMQEPKPKHRIALAAIVCSALVLVAYLCTRAFNKGADTVTTLFDKAVAVSSKFKTGTITSTFYEQLARVSGTGGDVLELATSQYEESFSRRDEKRILWDLVHLGTTVWMARIQRDMGAEELWNRVLGEVILLDVRLSRNSRNSS